MDDDFSSAAAGPQSLEEKLVRGAKRLDLETDDDRLFFERHEHRNHRLRQSAQIEVEQEEILVGPIVKPSGTRWFTIVKQLAPGKRVRRRVALKETLDPDVLSERQCEWLFDHVG
jgi:hypothetical protein